MRKGVAAPNGRYEDRRPRRRGWAAGLVAGILTSAAAAGACGPVEDVLDRVGSKTPRERYADGLGEAGLDSTVLGREWLAAGRRALEEPVGVELPFRETGYFPPERPSAVGYGFRIQRGRTLEVRVSARADGPVTVFLDLFRREGLDSLPRWERVASADTGALRLEREVEEDGAYVVRVQPELLRGVRYDVVLSERATLAFPVSGHDSRAIRSDFGAPREAGRRSHDGVDIFASRGTPVLAAAEGRVRRVGLNRLGGKIVWLRDARRSQFFYYAHLDSQTVRDGERVRPGDTVGLIGNTGNARTTPPHLHFGIYRRGEGPVDPLPWIRESRGEASPVAVDTSLLGAWARTGGRTNLRAGRGTGAEVLETLGPHTLARVEAGTGSWYRIRLPDGRGGFVYGPLLEPAAREVRRRVVSAGPLLESPRVGAVAVDSLPGPRSVAVLGTFRDYLYIRPGDGREGWIPAESG